MRFENGRESQNVEDRRGASGSGRGVRVGGKGIGIGTIVLALVAMYFGVDPSIVLNQASTMSEPPAQVSPAGRPAAENE